MTLSIRPLLRRIPGLPALARHVRLRGRAREIRALLLRLAPRSFGGDLIRFGPNGDGGYLIPDDLDGIAACFSPGVSTVSGFELDCAERGMLVFLADASVKGPAETHERFHFEKTYLGGAPAAGIMTLGDWVAKSGVSAEDDLLLQIDIEGAEYEVFRAAPRDLLNRFRIIVAEFHGLHRLLHTHTNDYGEIQGVLDKILETHFCVHVHPNNCCGSVRHQDIEIPKVMEFTFLRRDRGRAAAVVKAFPNPLDFDNMDKPTIVLPSCWYPSQPAT